MTMLRAMPVDRVAKMVGECSATIWVKVRIASSRNAPERAKHCLTRMLPSPRRFVNWRPIGIRDCHPKVPPHDGLCRSSLERRAPRLNAGRRGHTQSGARPGGPGGDAANPLSCSIGEPAFPSRPGAAGAAARNGGAWASKKTKEERSHPQPRAARPFARAWRGWRAPDLPRSEHRGTLCPSRRIRPSPFHWEALRHETRARQTGAGVRGERCLLRHLSGGLGAKHHFMRHLTPPLLQPAL